MTSALATNSEIFMPDVSKDFINLSRAVSENNDEAICYALVNIIANCLGDANYKKDAEENIVAYAANEAKIKEQLNFITKSTDQDYKLIQPIASEFLQKIQSATSAASINNGSQQVFFKEPLQINTSNALDNRSEEMLEKLSRYTIEKLFEINQETKVSIDLLQQRYQEKINYELQNNQLLLNRPKPEKM